MYSGAGTSPRQEVEHHMSDDSWEARLSSALDELQSAEDAIAAAKAERDRISQEVLDLIRDARERIDHDDSSAVRYDTFRKALRHIYWEQMSVSSTKLTTAAGLRSQFELMRAVGPLPSGKTCSRCGSEILITSRWARTLANSKSKTGPFSNQVVCDCP